MLIKKTNVRDEHRDIESHSQLQGPESRLGDTQWEGKGEFGRPFRTENDCTTRTGLGECRGDVCILAGGTSPGEGKSYLVHLGDHPGGGEKGKWGTRSDQTTPPESITKERDSGARRQERWSRNRGVSQESNQDDRQPRADCLPSTHHR